jgi:hypothetical protein
MVVKFYEEYDNFRIYLITYYNIIMLMLGGDNVPLNSRQAIIQAVITVTGQVTLALLFGKFNFLLFELFQNQQIYEKHQNSLTKLANFHKLDKELS